MACRTPAPGCNTYLVLVVLHKPRQTTRSRSRSIRASKLRNAILRIDPVPHQVVLDGRPFVRHPSYSFLRCSRHFRASASIKGQFSSTSCSMLLFRSSSDK
jgi:hypothetical protein